MEVSKYLHTYADTKIPHKQQAIIKAFAKALEVIPRQLCDNAGFDATDILNRLRVEHRKGNVWAGVDMINEGVRDNMEAFVWEPSLVKINAILAATEASCMILSVDETISEYRLWSLEDNEANPPFQKTKNLKRLRVRNEVCLRAQHREQCVEEEGECQDDKRILFRGGALLPPRSRHYMHFSSHVV